MAFFLYSSYFACDISFSSKLESLSELSVSLFLFSSSLSEFSKFWTFVIVSDFFEPATCFYLSFFFYSISKAPSSDSSELLLKFMFSIWRMACIFMVWFCSAVNPSSSLLESSSFKISSKFEACNPYL